MAKGKYQEWLTPEGLTKIKGWAMDGLSNQQIAHNMDIAEKTLYEWIKKHCKISEALKKSKEIADREVENATFKASKGYWVEEEKITVETKPDGSTTEKVEKTKKWIAPNPAMNIFWLKNRKPETWKNDPKPNEQGKDDKAHKEWIEKTSGEREEGLFDEFETEE